MNKKKTTRNRYHVDGGVPHARLQVQRRRCGRDHIPLRADQQNGNDLTRLELGFEFFRQSRVRPGETRVHDSQAYLPQPSPQIKQRIFV